MSMSTNESLHSASNKHIKVGRTKVGTTAPHADLEQLLLIDEDLPVGSNVIAVANGKQNYCTDANQLIAIVNQNGKICVPSRVRVL